MRDDQIEVLTPFLLERMRAGDDLLDGIFHRARELIERPEVGSSLAVAERAWAAEPEPIKRDESYSDWSRMLRPIPRSRGPVTDLADLRPTDSRPAFVSILRLVKPLPGEVVVFGIGAGDPRPAARIEPGSLPRGRLAGVAALTSYWSAVRRFRAVLPRDVARAASESLRALSARWLAGLPEDRVLDEETAAELLRAARRAEIDVARAERVFADQRDGRAPALEDVAYLFARPSPAYARAFDRLVGRSARPELHDAYARGGAFESLVDGPKPRDGRPAPIAVRVGAAAKPEGDREIDVGLAPTVPLVAAAAIASVPRGAASLRVALLLDGREVAEERRAASDSRYFRWVLEARGGSYRIVADALDADGAVAASGSSGELRVRQFAHCVRCPRRVDFADPAIETERECAWTASPRPATAATVAESDDLEMTARYGENERVREAARATWRASGRSRGRFVVPGEPAAPPIEYLGAHSPDRRLPDLPRIADTGEFERGSLVARRADEMRAREAVAADRDEDRETRDRAVEALRAILEGREAAERDPRELEKARARLGDALRDAIAAHRALFAREKESSTEDLEKIDAAEEALEIPEAEADLERFVGDAIERERGFAAAIARTLAAVERIVASEARLQFRIDAAKAFPGYREIPTLIRAVREAEEIQTKARSGKEARAEMESLRRKFVAIAKTIEKVSEDARARLAKIRAERRQTADVEGWIATAAPILADLEAIPFAPDFSDAVDSAIADSPRAISNSADVEAVAKAMIEIDYEGTRDRIAGLRARLAQIAERPPAAADPMLVARVASTLDEARANLGSWTREATEKAARISDWREIVAGYFDKLREFAPRANLERMILEQIGKADDPDARAAELEASWTDVARFRRALERAAVSAKIAAEDLGKEIGADPPPLAGDFEDALEGAKDARRARVEAERDRDRETADEARRRRAKEFEEFENVGKFDEIAAGVAAAEDRLRPGKATAIDDVAAIDADLGELEEIQIATPAGASAAEAADLLRPRRDRLATLRVRLLDGDEIRNALAADLVISRAFETFAHRSAGAAETALDARLAHLDRSAGMLERASEFRDYDELRRQFQARRVTIEKRGLEAVARLRVTELAEELARSIASANAEIARESEASEDLEEAVRDLIDVAGRRADAIELLRATEERMLAANGEYAREHGGDVKAESVRDSTAAASRLFADYARASDDSFARRRVATLAALRGAKDLDLARRLVRELEDERIEDANEVGEALRRRELGDVEDLREMAAAVDVPSAGALLFDRGAALVTLAQIASLRDRPGAEGARASLDEAEERARAALEPARLVAMRAIASAYTLAKYGGEPGDFATRARDFLARDAEMYGEVFAEDVVVLGGYTFSRDMLPPGEIEKILAGFRNVALTDERCSVDSYVRPGADTCALDSVVMLAAKADPQIMGRILGARDSQCARDFSFAMRRIDQELERGRIPSDTCDEMRAMLMSCEARDERLRQILFEAGDRARPKRTLDVADVLGWLNAVYVIEPVGLIVEGVTVPESTKDTMSGILREGGATSESIAGTFRAMDETADLERKADILGSALMAAGVMPTKAVELVARFSRNPIAPPPIATRTEHPWPYSFSVDLFEGTDALHEVAVEDPVEAPRSFAIHPIDDRAGALAEMIRTGIKKIHAKFARWGYAYELVAIVHWRPGHYWITLRCGDAWYRYDSTRSQVFRRLGYPLDAETLDSMQILFYARGARIAAPPGEVANV